MTVSNFVDVPPQGNETNYAAVVATVKGIQPRALTPPQYEDVVTLLEWMQEQCVAQDSNNTQRSAALDKREAELVARERDLAIRMRAVSAAAKVKTVGSRLTLWGRK